MKKTNGQKGITLVALIITIVVLLILAAVAISSITDNGILGHATNAATKYNSAVKNEQDMIKEYEDYLTNNSNIISTFKINGTTYNFKAGMTWLQWINSDYNTAGVDYVTIMHSCNWQDIVYLNDKVVSETSYYALNENSLVNKEIRAGYNYYLLVDEENAIS